MKNKTVNMGEDKDIYIKNMKTIIRKAKLSVLLDNYSEYEEVYKFILNILENGYIVSNVQNDSFLIDYSLYLNEKKY